MRNLLIYISLSLVAVVGWTAVEAQSLEEFKRQLSDPVQVKLSEEFQPLAKVTAREFGDAAQAVRESSQSVDRYRFRGYRVCIFFDNGQNARAEAVEAKEKFVENFPNIPVYMVYENPYFKVTVGNCLTAEEAIILKGKVVGTFPKAFPKKEELTAVDLLK